MKLHKFLIAFTLIFSSCKKDIQVLNYGDPEGYEVMALPVSIEKERVLLYSDLYSQVDYIRLETTEQSLVGEVSKLEVMDNGDLIILDGRKGSVLRFDRNGKYLCHLGKCGNGHGEYVSPSDFAYDRYNDCVIVLDEGGGKLVSYDMDGKYLSSTQLGYSPAAIAVIDKTHLCLYMNHFDNLDRNTIGHNVKITDRKGLLVSESMEFDASMCSFHPDCSNVFFSMDSVTCMKQPFSSVIYSFDNVTADRPSLKPEWYVDFGEKKIPQEWYKEQARELTERLKTADEITYLYSVHKVKDRVLLNIGKSDMMYLSIRDLKDSTCKEAYAYAYNDIYGFVSPILIAQVMKDKCYYVIHPSSFDQYKELIEDGCSTFCIVDQNGQEKEYVPSQRDLELLCSIHDDDNPIIQVCTLKD